MSAVHSRALALYAGIRLNPVPIAASTPISGVSLGGATIGDVSATAATGLSTAQLAQSAANTASANAYAALNGLSAKLEAGSSYVLQGDITLGSAGHGLYTTGFAGGNGLAFTDNGIVMRQGGVTTVSMPSTGFPTFAGAFDCGAGGIFRTAALATGSAVVELIKIQNDAGQQFGALRQGDLYAGSGAPAAGWEFNFAGQGLAVMGVSNTSNGYAGKLLVDSAGFVSAGRNWGGGWSYFAVPVCNGVQHNDLNADMVDSCHVGHAFGNIPLSDGALNSGLNAEKLNGWPSGNNYMNIPISNGTVCSLLNADQLDGYHASSFSQASHNHTVDSLSNSTGWRRCGTAHWNGATWDYDEFWLQLRTN